VKPELYPASALSPLGYVEFIFDRVGMTFAKDELHILVDDTVYFEGIPP
jgi:hypothetical protein